jgi:amino acid transporter
MKNTRKARVTRKTKASKTKAVGAKISAPSKVMQPSHSLGDLYWHNLAAIIGIAVIVVPTIVAYLSGIASIFLVLFAGIIAMMVGSILYDIEVTHHQDPYNFLKNAVNREYAFIFGFLLLIGTILAVVIASELSVLELQTFLHGFYGLIASVVIVELFLASSWALLLREGEKGPINLFGALKLLFVIVLILVAIIAISALHKFTPLINATTISAKTSQTAITTATGGYAVAGPSGSNLALTIVILFWAFAGFETGSLVYKGEDRGSVAQALIYAVLTAIILYTILQIFVVGIVGGYAGVPLTPNVVSGSLGIYVTDILVLFAIVILFGSILVLSNNASEILHQLAFDNIVPASLIDRPNLKYGLALGIPMVLLLAMAFSVGPVAPNSIESAIVGLVSVIAITSMTLMTAFAFLALGFSYKYARISVSRLFSGVFAALVLFGIIAFTSLPLIFGLLVILALSAIGYVIVARK